MVNQNDKPKGFFLSMLALGAMCGLVEVVVGNALHQSGIHLSALLIGLGCILLGIGLAIYKNPLMIIGMGLTACLCKQLVVPVLGLSFMCEANSCLAVLLEYGSLAGMSALTMNSMRKNADARILTAGSGIFLGSVIYYFLGMRVSPCQYMLSFNVSGGFVNFIAKEGLIWSAFSAALFPLGWSIGERLTEKTTALLQQKPRYFYLVTALSSTACCLIACIISITLQG